MIFERQKRRMVRYKGYTVGDFIADLVIDNTLLIETEAIYDGLEQRNKAQTINYLVCLHLSVGLLINFRRSVEVRRFISRSHLSNP